MAERREGLKVQEDNSGPDFVEATLEELQAMGLRRWPRGPGRVTPEQFNRLSPKDQNAQYRRMCQELEEIERGGDEHKPSPARNVVRRIKIDLMPLARALDELRRRGVDPLSLRLVPKKPN